MKPTWISLRPSSASRLDHLERGGDIGGERLLAHHRLAVLQAGQQLFLVRRTGRREHDGVNLGVGDRVERVGDGAAAGDARSELLCFIGHVVIDDDSPLRRRFSM